MKLMKKVLLVSSLAALTLVGCTTDQLPSAMGDAHAKDGAISFAGIERAVTRADITGVNAANQLGKNFVVEGVNGDGSIASQTEVFDHYNVNWIDNTASTTQSNSSNWEYVGQTKHTLSASSQQAIKFWDYGKKQYDFIAFSYGANGATGITLSDINYANLGKAVVSGDAVYTVTGNAEKLAGTYIADLVSVYNRDGVSEYGTTVVTPRFRSLGTKVRLAFYETVPGYAVSNVKFYSEAWDESTATTAAGVDAPTLFSATAVFPSAASTGKMSVYYPTVGWDKSGKASGSTIDPDYNQAHVVFSASATSGEELVKTKTFGTALTYTAAKEGAETCTNILGRTSSTATYAGDPTVNNAYQIVLPLGSAENLQLRIEYDLYPIDGGAEVIHVRDARAVIPAQYCNWKPNYAYTYIFKISDATNGWTGVDGSGAVVEGLTPITFNAVVVSSEDGVQETITAVATPTITTYQEGVVVSAGSEYKAGAVYVSVQDGATVTGSNITLYSAASTSTVISEATAELAFNQGKSDPSTDVYDKTNVTLTQLYGGSTVAAIPGADGNNINVAAYTFTAASGTTYVVRYSNGTKTAYKVIKVQ